MLLDDIMPRSDFQEAHSIAVQATRERVWQAIYAVTPTEIPLLQALFAARALPGRLTGHGQLRFAGERPLLRQMLRSGFVLLGEEPERELVVGAIGQFWKPRGAAFVSFAGRDEFLAYDRPTMARAAMSFLLIPVGDRITVRTETRVLLPDPGARRRFARYWRVIYPGSALIRRMTLRAIKRRAEHPDHLESDATSA